MKRTLLLSALALVTFQMVGQRVPGYLGHRLSISYQAYLFPAFANPTATADYEEDLGSGNSVTDPSFGINLQHHLVLDYALGKKWGLSASALYARNAFKPGGRSGVAVNDYGRFSALGFVVGFKKYKEHFAPLGSFIEYRLGYTRLMVDDLEYQIVGNAPSETQMIEGGPTGGLTLGLGIGKNRVINDRFLITYGVNLSFFFKGFTEYYGILLDRTPESSISYDQTSDGQRDQDALMARAAGRYFIQNLINFKIGVGLLP